MQISGGEPTTHPDFFDILDMCKSRPIKHIMVNTNGIRIAQDRDFARRLAEYMPGFEIYLQFDSFEEHVLKELRGADLRRIRRQAIEHLNEFNISTTLVVTLKKGSMTAKSATSFSTGFSKRRCAASPFSRFRRRDGWRV